MVVQVEELAVVHIVVDTYFVVEDMVRVAVDTYFVVVDIGRAVIHTLVVVDIGLDQDMLQVVVVDIDLVVSLVVVDIDLVVSHIHFVVGID